MGRTFPFWFFILLIALFSLPGIWDLVRPGYIASHDGIGHVIRLSEFDLALRDGHIPPRMSKNLMYGYGYYFFNFNYPLLYWSGELLHLLGLDFADALKGITILGLVLSGLAMFLWQRTHWGNWGALLAAIFYMYAPYRLLNIYVRGAIAEHLAFIMLPLLFMYSEKIAEDERKKRGFFVILGGISYALLLLSHNIMAFIFSLVLGLFMLFHLYLYRSWRVLLGFLGVGIIGLALSAFFWVPSILEKQFVRLDQTIGKDFPQHFVYPLQLILPSWGYGGSGPGPNDSMSFQIGILHLIFLFLSVIVVRQLWKDRRQKASHVLFYLLVFAASVFFMLGISKMVWEMIPLLRFTQFPWRFLSWTVFAASVLAGGVVYWLENYFWQAKPARAYRSVLVVAIALIISSLFYFRASQHLVVTVPKDQPIAGSHTWADEQLPVWFDPKPTSFPSSRVEVISGEAKLEILSWKTPRHQYTVDASTPVTLVENTAYYPGWKLLVNDQEYNFNFQGKFFPGRIVYSLPAGNHQITSIFTETPLRKSMNLFSLVSLVLVLILLPLSVRKF